MVKVVVVVVLVRWDRFTGRLRTIGVAAFTLQMAAVRGVRAAGGSVSAMGISLPTRGRRPVEQRAPNGSDRRDRPVLVDAREQNR
jgi:hypothetical protein